MDLDRYDAAILDELQRDGRLPIVDLAEEVGLSSTPCARRVKLMEQDGIIQGYTAVIDPSRLGLKVQALRASPPHCAIPMRTSSNSAGPWTAWRKW